MQQLYTEEEFQNAKSRDLLPLKCLNCNETFYRQKHHIQEAIRDIHKLTYVYCSRKCQFQHHHPRGSHPVDVICNQCSTHFMKEVGRIKKSKHHFCSQSCAGKYHNTHKTKGTRISKLEKWLAVQLPILYPTLEFHFNRTDAINSELDIFVPSLKLAFELNGVFHYIPVFGDKKLQSTQANDINKVQACQEKRISLCVIDVSHQKYFKEQTCKPFLTIIENLINLKLSKS